MIQEQLLTSIKFGKNDIENRISESLFELAKLQGRMEELEKHLEFFYEKQHEYKTIIEKLEKEND